MVFQSRESFLCSRNSARILSISQRRLAKREGLKRN
jgi:hypothetical protein